MSGNSDTPPPRKNPFSPMAVAKITGFTDSDSVDLTIETDAIKRATAYVSDYLRTPPPEEGTDQAGNVIAVLGDYGTGKTHLALRLVKHASQTLRDPARAMYLDATADKFVELYRRFMRKLGLDGVRKQVSDYYADVVAESLQSIGLTSDVVEWLRNRELEPQHVVERLGLMESALLRKVQQALRRVTDNDDFGTALTLLLRSGFDDAVWAWLTGEKPDKVLVERGITRPIDSEVAALEAMGVFALLYGGRQGRFLLVVDELDKIFSGANQPEADTMAAFQTMLEVFANAGACLVLSGLPEFRRVLRASVQQRISHTVEMAGLDAEEISAFIRLAQRAEFGENRLEPFTTDSVRYLRDLTGGNPRNVIRLCHDVFRRVDDRIHETGDPDVLVTDKMVDDAAREQFGSLSADDIHGVARRILDANGWNYRQDHFLGTSQDSKVDFWVTFEDRTGGCAVLITRSLLNGSDATGVLRRITAARDAAPDGQVILVVNGMLTATASAQLRDPLGGEPLVYVERGFTEHFKALVGATSQRLPRTDGGEPMTAVRQKIDQINRQQSSIYGVVEQLAEHIDGARAASDRQFAALHRQLSALSRQAEDVAGPATGPTGPVRLPPEVDRLFRDALDVLEELTQLDVMLTEAFDPTDEDIHEDVQRRLRSPGFFEAIGVAILMRRSVSAFQTAVAEWYRTEIPASADEPSDQAEDRLDMLCRAYDDVFEYLPMFHLDPLIHLSPWISRGGVVAEVGQAGRRGRVRAALDNFSPRVRRAALRAWLASGS